MGGKAALVLVLGFAFVWGYVCNNLSGVSGRAVGNASLYVSAVESHNIALSGANAGVAKLYHDSTNWRGTVKQNLTSGTVSYTAETLADSNILLTSVSSCVGARGMLHDTVRVYFDKKNLQSFSLYAWMTGNENGVLWVSGDTVWGRVHSNSNLSVSGSPVFMGKVTTTGGINKRSSTDNPIFKAGLEQGIASIDFPADFSSLKNAAAAGGRSYTGDITVMLYPGTSATNDGYAIVTSGTLKDTIKLNSPSFNGALVASGQVSVSGTLDGKLSICSLANVYVTGSILYENKSVKISDDVLGLVAEQKVIVADNAANSAGCEIDASIFVRNGSFTAENYGRTGYRGPLRVLGSIVQKIRGPVGTASSGGGVATGYSKRYTYDDRLNNNNFRPPFYPGFYRKTPKIAGWWESMRTPEWWD
jgi:cytoskeletal protein CcmA (bactofilin family)